MGSTEIKTNIFVKKKTGYYSICEFESRFIDGESGRKWVIALKEIGSESGIFICNSKGKVLGFNERVYCILGDSSITGEYFD